MNHKKFVITAVAVFAALTAGTSWLLAKNHTLKAILPKPVQQAALTPAPNPATTTPTLGIPTATPNIIVVNTPVTVTVKVQITDPSVLPGGVNLLRLGATGTQPTILGVMHDDGLAGDKAAGDHVFTLQLTFNEIYTGQELLQASAAFKGILKRVLSPTSSITVGFADPANGISFQVPLLSVPATVTKNSTAETPAYDVSVQKGTSLVPVLGLLVYENPSKNSLQDWFSKEIDPQNVLASAGTYQHMSLSNGLEALLAINDVPDSYEGGPIEYAFVMSPNQDRVVSITQAQGDQLIEFGYSQDQTVEIMKEIISTVHF